MKRGRVAARNRKQGEAEGANEAKRAIRQAKQVKLLLNLSAFPGSLPRRRTHVLSAMCGAKYGGRKILSRVRRRHQPCVRRFKRKFALKGRFALRFRHWTGARRAGGEKAQEAATGADGQ